MPGTRKLGRTTSHRIAMLKGLVTLLLEKGQIETTVTRAKELSAFTDRVITMGKTNTLASRRMAATYITREDVLKNLFNRIAPNYENRNGGYTQIYKIGPRRGDGAEMAIIQLVDADKIFATREEVKAKNDAKDAKADKKAAKKSKKVEGEALEA